MKRHLNLESELRQLPRQFLAGFALGEATQFPPSWRAKRVSRVVFCGMGGSALPGLILNRWLRNIKHSLRVEVWRNYNLPPLEKNDLVIVSSYSGNTEEALSSFAEAVRQRKMVIVLASGGKLRVLAAKRKIPVIMIPIGLLPRFAIGYLAGALCGALAKLELVPTAYRDLRKVAKRTRMQPIIAEAKRLARFFENKIPLVYTTEAWKTLGHIWKVSFNETAKIPAFHYILPELDHNELQGFTAKPLAFNRNFGALFLGEKRIHPRLLKRFLLTQRFFIKRGRVNSKTIILGGRNFWEELLFGTLLAYWTGYFLALRRRVNPTDDRLIEEFKRLMK